MKFLPFVAVLVAWCGIAVGQSLPPAAPLRISAGVIAGNLQSKVQPVYPAEAKAQGVEGTVVMHAMIGKDGTIKDLTIISGNSLLTDAALVAVKQWTYRPYLLNGVPTEVETTINVNFSINRRPLRISGGIATAMLLTKVDPVYPAQAKASGIKGMVVLQAFIGKDGRVENLQLISGDIMLGKAAIDAVKQWTYRPYRLNGDPIEVETTVAVTFPVGS